MSLRPPGSGDYPVRGMGDVFREMRDKKPDKKGKKEEKPSVGTAREKLQQSEKEKAEKSSPPIGRRVKQPTAPKSSTSKQVPTPSAPKGKQSPRSLPAIPPGLPPRPERLAAQSSTQVNIEKFIKEMIIEDVIDDFQVVLTQEEEEFQTLSPHDKKEMVDDLFLAKPRAEIIETLPSYVFSAVDKELIQKLDPKLLIHITPKQVGAMSVQAQTEFLLTIGTTTDEHGLSLMKPDYFSKILPHFKPALINKGLLEAKNPQTGDYFLNDTNLKLITFAQIKGMTQEDLKAYMTRLSFFMTNQEMENHIKKLKESSL